MSRWYDGAGFPVLERGTGPVRRLAWATALAIVVVGAALGVGSAVSLVAPADPSDHRQILVHIPAGAATHAIGDLLARRGIVKNGLAFAFAARLAGRQAGLKAGWYRFSPSMTTRAILDRLAAGDVARFQVTIPEGYTVSQVAARLVQAGVGSPESVAVAMDGRDPVRAWLPPDAPVKEPLEGYLFPDTYTFEYGITPAAAVQAMVRRFGQAWTPDMIDRAKAESLSIHQATTLASIIELETRFPEDRPLVSAVFHNRLKRGMPLRSDVTTAYAAGKPASKLTRADFADASPYNTYVTAGLPPGPICDPSLDALRAALEPAAVPYLYFVAEPDGHLLYATTFAQHLENVRKARAMKGK